jgi:hypothetical protein
VWFAVIDEMWRVDVSTHCGSGRERETTARLMELIFGGMLRSPLCHAMATIAFNLDYGTRRGWVSSGDYFYPFWAFLRYHDRHCFSLLEIKAILLTLRCALPCHTNGYPAHERAWDTARHAVSLLLCWYQTACRCSHRTLRIPQQDIHDVAWWYSSLNATMPDVFQQRTVPL